MRLRLSEALPLRTTRMLGDFADDRVLPLRFGDLRETRVPLVKLDDARWLAADHVMPITAAYVNDERTASYDVITETDLFGHAWTVVRLAAPAPPNSRVSASGTGLEDPDTGELIENPAAIMEYVLRLAGRDEIFPLLRAETSAAGIVFAGSIDSEKTIQAWLDELAYSCGAIWTTALARLYPTTTINGAPFDLDVESTGSILVTASIEDTADVLRLGYDWNAAVERPGQYLELTANPQRFGGFVAERVLKWVRRATNAESIGKRVLERMAGDRYNIQLATDETALRPCAWVRIVRKFGEVPTTAHPQWPLAGDVPVPMLLSVDVGGENAREAQQVLEWVKSVPAVAVTAHTVALPDTRGGAVELAIRDGVLTITVTDNDGTTTIKDALVSLDGGAYKKTNEAGTVTFLVAASVPPKKHTVLIQAPGKAPATLEVLL